MAEPKSRLANATDVVIIGAGPYGLSIAAYLAARGVSYRIFGDPMSAWANQMPKGMHLKSEGFASSLAEPENEFTFARYCHQEGLAYKDTGHPVPLEAYVSYGRAFQKKFVPGLEIKMVISVHKSPTGFELALDTGERIFARKVVVAVGISRFAYLPPVLSGIPNDLLSHSSAHHNLEAFRGRDVAVVGAGASALDLAALLHETGASVQVLARRSVVRFHDPPQPRSIVDRILRPMTVIGAGRQLYFYANAPWLFRYLPERLRLDRVRKTLGPAPGWFVKEKVVGKVPLHLGLDITAARITNDRVCLTATDEAGNGKTFESDHIIAATGYRIDLQRLGFLDSAMSEKIRLTDRSPALSSNFESSVSGLYFVGVAAANTFGPLMRFTSGARFTARRLSRHLAGPALGKSKIHGEMVNPQTHEEI
jgi:lysine/ornithine N-monooxygenase